MLSAESAAGKYPELSVQMQQRIINRVEGDRHYSNYLQNSRPKITDGSTASAIILAARSVAKNVGAKVIASFTVGGATARKASMKRPGMSRQYVLTDCLYTRLPLLISFVIQNNLSWPSHLGSRHAVT